MHVFQPLLTPKPPILTPNPTANSPNSRTQGPSFFLSLTLALLLASFLGGGEAEEDDSLVLSAMLVRLRALVMPGTSGVIGRNRASERPDDDDVPVCLGRSGVLVVVLAGPVADDSG